MEIQLSRGQEGMVGIPLTSLTPPHVCVCLKPGPEFFIYLYGSMKKEKCAHLFRARFGIIGLH